MSNETKNFEIDIKTKQINYLTDDELKERRKETYKKHYENNRDYYLLQKSILYQLNKETQNARRRAYYQKHKK